MEKIARKLTDLVGNTPLLELSNYNKSQGVQTDFDDARYDERRTS